MAYAWIIDVDHLDSDFERNAVGVSGPSEAPDRLVAFLQDRDWDERDGVEVFTFTMYDDDGERYVTGRMITDEGASEDACYSPLGDYGAGGLGCVVVKYRGHPEMDCG